MDLWTSESSWALLEELSGVHPAGVSDRTLDRVRGLIAVTSAETIVRVVAPRTAVTHLCTRSAGGSLASIRSEIAELRDELVLTAGSADEALDTDLAPDRFRLDGYLRESVDFAGFVRDHGLTESGDGAITIWSKPSGFSWDAAEIAPVGVIAADLSASIATRERSAGLAALERLRAGYLAR
jgi:hypothetical protein